MEIIMKLKAFHAALLIKTEKKNNFPSVLIFNLWNKFRHIIAENDK